MYFKKFPKVDYDFNRTGTTQKMINIFRSVRPVDTFIDEPSAYSIYEVKNGERPDIVSQRIYGTSIYYWTFFVINEFLHDGYRSWPLSQEDLFDYLQKEYEGYVITTNPQIVRNTDQIITDHRNSLSGRFDVGQTLYGTVSGAKGRITKKNIDMNQLVVQDVTLGTSGVNGITGASDSNVIGGAFIGNPEAINNSTETVRQQGANQDFVDTYRVFKYLDAPYYYYNENDADKKPVTNAIFVEGGVAESDLSYVTYRAHEEELNEQRSRIRYIHPNYINDFVKRFESLLNV